jgi:Domain of unknown function (DUF374)
MNLPSARMVGYSKISVISTAPGQRCSMRSWIEISLSELAPGSNRLSSGSMRRPSSSPSQRAGNCCSIEMQSEAVDGALLLAPASAFLRTLFIAGTGTPALACRVSDQSVDGELGAMILRRLGGAVIRGSSSHTGAQALKGYFQALMREQVSPVINRRERWRRGGTGCRRRHGASPPRDLSHCPGSTVEELSLGKIRG